MAVTQYASDAPSVRRLMPDDQKLCLPKTLSGLDVAKLLVALFNGTKPFDGIDLEAAGD